MNHNAIYEEYKKNSILRNNKDRKMSAQSARTVQYADCMSVERLWITEYFSRGWLLITDSIGSSSYPILLLSASSCRWLPSRLGGEAKNTVIPTCIYLLYITAQSAGNMKYADCISAEGLDPPPRMS